MRCRNVAGAPIPVVGSMSISALAGCHSQTDPGAVDGRHPHTMQLGHSGHPDLLGSHKGKNEANMNITMFKTVLKKFTTIAISLKYLSNSINILSDLSITFNDLDGKILDKSRPSCYFLNLRLLFFLLFKQQPHLLNNLQLPYQNQNS